MRAVLLLFVAPMALVATSCGDTLSLDPVAKAATESAKQTSEHMHMTARVSSGARVISMSGEGDFANNPTLGKLTVGVISGGRVDTMREVMQGTRVYLSSDLLAGQLPAGKTWMSLDIAKAGKSLGIDFRSYSSQSPADTLAQLKASSSVQVVGRETVGGARTTHYTSTLDPAKLAKLEQATHVHVDYRPADVWIDGRGLVRKLHMAFDETDAAGAASSSDITIELSKYGERVPVVVPFDWETYDVTDAATNAIKDGGRT
jgi:hypothetical protein